MGGQEIKSTFEEPTLRFYGPQHTFENRVKRGLGWLPDTPDLRDMTLDYLAPPVAKKKESVEAFNKVTGAIGSSMHGLAHESG